MLLVSPPNTRWRRARASVSPSCMPRSWCSPRGNPNAADARAPLPGDRCRAGGGRGNGFDRRHAQPRAQGQGRRHRLAACRVRGRRPAGDPVRQPEAAAHARLVVEDQAAAVGGDPRLRHDRAPGRLGGEREAAAAGGIDARAGRRPNRDGDALRSVQRAPARTENRHPEERSPLFEGSASRRRPGRLILEARHTEVRQRRR